MKKVIVATLVGISASGVVLASAAALGIAPMKLGAGSGVVAACDDAVSTSYATAFDSAQGYRVTGVVISGLAAGCNGAQVGATITDGSNTTVASPTSVTVTNSATTVTLPLTTPLAVASLGRIHVVIS